MGSSIYGASVKAEGKENVSYKAIKNYLTGLDSRITCAEDPDEEFNADIKGSSHVPTLNFSISGTHIFKLYRESSLADYSKRMVFSMDAGNGIPANTKGIRNGEFTPDESRTWDAEVSRGLTISHIINNNFIFLSFTAIDSSQNIRNSDNAGFMYCASDSKVYLCSFPAVSPYDKSHIFNLSSYTLYDLATPGTVGTFLSRFSYAAPAGEIDYIKSSIYMNNDTKQFENRAIYDCTSVNVGDTVSLNDGSYVAVGPHQLVKVS